MPINKHRERKGGRQRIKSCTHTHTHIVAKFFLNYWFISIHKYHKSKFIIGIYLYINTNNPKNLATLLRNRGEKRGEREKRHTHIYIHIHSIHNYYTVLPSLHSLLILAEKIIYFLMNL